MLSVLYSSDFLKIYVFLGEMLHVRLEADYNGSPASQLPTPHTMSLSDCKLMETIETTRTTINLADELLDFFANGTSELESAGKNLKSGVSLIKK
jgi:hypothetical protein